MKYLVIGDVCLDEYIHGDVFGTAPEAPVPVLKVTKKEHSLGMAANVAKQLKLLYKSNKVTLLTAAPKNETFENLLKKLKIEYINYDDGRQFTVKQRTVTNNVYLSRNDYEDLKTFTDYHTLLHHHQTALKKYDAIVLSDYGKGVLNESQEIIKQIQAKCLVPIFVDPDKLKNYTAYQGVFCIKANLKESLSITKSDNYMQALDKLQNVFEFPVITLGEKGCVYVDKTEKYQSGEFVKTVDVTGAGDTFLANLVHTYCKTKNKSKAIKVANAAASKSVTKFGV